LSEFSKPKVPDSKTTEGLLERYLAWIEKNGIDPTGVPFITMTLRDLDVFRSARGDEMNYLRQIYKIPSADQQNCVYALIRISDSPIQSESLFLVDVTDRDFGTTIDIPDDSKTSKPPIEPNNPSSPALMYNTEDIGDTLVIASQELHAFAEKIMRGKKSDPFYSSHGDIGIRAGEVKPGQKDAYIWQAFRITNSLSLTINFPFQYKCVAIIRGQQVDAANRKPGMAQILNPSEVFKIEGEELEEIQKIYLKLFEKPDYVLSEQQRKARRDLFETSLVTWISEQARQNQMLEDEERRRRRRRRNNQNRRHIGGS
jgi:hypothetical protein